MAVVVVFFKLGVYSYYLSLCWLMDKYIMSHDLAAKGPVIK